MPNLVFWVEGALNQTAKVLVLTCCGTGFNGGGIVGGGTNLGVATVGVGLAKQAIEAVGGGGKLGSCWCLLRCSNGPPLLLWTFWTAAHDACCSFGCSSSSNCETLNCVTDFDLVVIRNWPLQFFTRLLIKLKWHSNLGLGERMTDVEFKCCAC